MSLVYGIIYLTFTLYPLAFRKYRKWGAVKASLPFLSILLGVIIACFLLAIHSIYHVTALYQKKKHHVPETRLPPMILGSLLLPAGMSIVIFFETSALLTSWKASFGSHGHRIQI